MHISGGTKLARRDVEGSAGTGIIVGPGIASLIVPNVAFHEAIPRIGCYRIMWIDKLTTNGEDPYVISTGSVQALSLSKGAAGPGWNLGTGSTG